MTDKRFVILCCKNLIAEVDAAVAGMPGASVISYPPHCGHVRSVWDTVSSYYEEAALGGSTVFFCGCGCQNTFDIPAGVMESPDFIFGGSGASLFLPEFLVRSYEKEGCMLILPGFLLKWRENAACNGLDEATAGEIYGEALSEVLLIDTAVRPGISDELAEFSKFTGLSSRIIPAGTENLRLKLESAYLKWSFEAEKAGFKQRVLECEKKAADYSMIAELTDRIIGIYDEETIIHEVLDLFVLLFSPKKISYIKSADGKPGKAISVTTGEVFPDESGREFFSSGDETGVSSSGDGFFVRVTYGGVLKGIISVKNVLFPEHLDKYLNPAQFICRIAGLSIAIAETYRELVQTVSDRNYEITERRKAERALKQANKKLSILSGITRHDILNNLMVIQGYLDLTDSLKKDSVLDGYLLNISSAASGIQRQIEFTREYEELGAEDPVWIDPGTVIRKVGQARIPVISDCKGFEIFADPMIEKVFYNLYDNTLRHGEGATEVRVSCGPEKRTGDDMPAEGKESLGYVIVFEDDGCGVPDCMKKSIFDRGVGSNTGLGLYLIREILAITGITIAETGVYGEGVRFEMTVPEGGWRIVA
ncbi:sensor histidine kinase [Methanoplanus endosymbiosus]|uniref:HAMP domain-containing histidine kinase n=1 Tax=Methanoplanus endosymbiosus TaxID=33865 RepID=A0A9E7PMB4_9EURY|nr:HAMP domain-containing sensor histidine kinase [Methanoplanus endosymbiosus]UUX92500.1 HAMP domain-containing histidine kinase [Methanoplanus endosymbiosus]